MRQQATKTTEVDILAFSMRLPKHDVKGDIVYSINTCYRCFELETHTTKNCPKEKEYTISSECSEEGQINLETLRSKL